MQERVIGRQMQDDVDVRWFGEEGRGGSRVVGWKLLPPSSSLPDECQSLLPMNPSSPFPSANPSPGVIGEPSNRHHGSESKGQFLLQLLQRGGGRGGRESISNGERTAGGAGEKERLPPQDYPHVIGSDDLSRWQLQDPAVAALGCSQSFQQASPSAAAAGDASSQLSEPNQLFMSSQYGGGGGGGGGWAPQQQQQHQHHFYPPSFDPRGYASQHPQLLHQHQQQLSPPMFPRYPLPLQAVEGHQRMVESRMLDPPRQLDSPWLPPPQLRQSATESMMNLRAWGSLIPTNAPKTPLPPPPPQPPEPVPPPQQFYGNGAELLQLLLGQAPQNPAAQNSPTKSASIVDTGHGTELMLNASTVVLPGGMQNQKPAGTIVHGPIGPPPKRTESLHSTRTPPSPKDLLGRFWAVPPNAGSPPDNSLPTSKLNLAPNWEDPVRNSIHAGTSSKESMNHAFEVLQPQQQQQQQQHPQRNFEFSGDKMRSGKSNLMGFLGDSAIEFPSEFDFVSPGAKGFQESLKSHEVGREGVPPGGGFPDGSTPIGSGLKIQTSRPSDDRVSPVSTGETSAVVGAGESLRFPTMESEKGACLLRNGGRVAGRCNGSGRGEIGRKAGQIPGGQWVANSPPPGKEDSSTATRELVAGGKLREDLKRRRGIQEWRMKQPSSQQSSPSPTKQFSSPESIASATKPCESEDEVQSAGVLPLALQVDHPGLPSRTARHLTYRSAMEEPKKKQSVQQQQEGVDNGCSMDDAQENGLQPLEEGLAKEHEEGLIQDFSGCLSLVEDSDPSSEMWSEGRRNHARDSRQVGRPHQQRDPESILLRGDMRYRPDLETFTPQLLAIHKGLIPSQEEKKKQRQFLAHLDSLVCSDWPGAKLFLYGSCANDFGVCNSDIDVCLAVDDENFTKAQLVVKMAEILRSDNMQNVQALTHARVPIVKFTDPVTRISCDICVNNMLAVVNSKLLHDYSQVDPRLRQLAFLVKHWAKCRQVNETYRGTLSSYAYVLMCIHFLQQRKPAILPCLQEMQPTYEVVVGKIKCAYFDQVDKLKSFGEWNKELVGTLLMGFFDYWAFHHDYNRSVISVRTGGFLSKEEKDWTRRIGNERHLICIEDPFEVSHDLGRVVDRHSIRVLRDEFNRAAKILRQDPNPCTSLFEPFIRERFS
ncbi:unnamed protein product [Sphagnum tenellum]